ncbi:hypothetical protein DWF00_14740 [Bosea caraganae]|uniref:Uncharacterized protein n=2 Tax=Bosea caraganae TaxID=2763117 RepID=A0A370KYJ5_9HYPH|nr:hypothetical protein DWE98_26625 [Bosea caraganae]RDJ25662.1 hypothetical protein DWF00_14740 [Bosea caraganae]
MRAPLRNKGGICDGKLIDYMASTYTPNPGFRGQDRFTIKYDSITDDGGGRETRSTDIVVDVK